MAFDYRALVGRFCTAEVGELDDIAGDAGLRRGGPGYVYFFAVIDSSADSRVVCIVHGCSLDGHTSLPQGAKTRGLTKCVCRGILRRIPLQHLLGTYVVTHVFVPFGRHTLADFGA
ncbi:hypothetical protein D3C77_361450 [compost metagenome]